MRLLLDTHALLWWVSGDASLSAKAQEAISREEVMVSSVSAYEINQKVRFGKLPSAVLLARKFEEEVAEQGFVALPITLAHARIAGAFISPHRDPFDRLLAAQALSEGLTMVTADPAFASFGVPQLW